MADIHPGAEELEILDERVDPHFGAVPGPGSEAGEPAAVEGRSAQESGEERPQPSFVLSCNRAGSTLLRFILDTHPEVYCPPELFLGQAAHSLAIFLCGLDGRISYFEADGKIYVSEGIAATVRNLLSERLVAQMSSKGKRIWCEKTPQNVHHLQLLEILFPQAKYVCLHRHCCDVVVSAMKLAGRISAIQKYIYRSEGHVLTGTIRWWCDVTRSLLEMEEKHPERCFRLRYEDLVTDPGSVLPPLFSFLGVDWNAELLETVFSSQHDRGYEDPNIRFTSRIHADSMGTGAELSLDGVPDEVASDMRGLLARLGYPELISQAGGAAEAATEITMPWFFETFLPERLAARPDLAAGIDRTFVFAIDGPGGGTWVVDMRQGGSREVREGAGSQCTVMVSAADLAAISRGKLNPNKAYADRKLRLAGKVDLAILERLTQLLRQPAAEATEQQPALS
jgi:protein-tyrosine sulfotransferase